ncbi:MAG: uroporphyrinogen decarboxylase family protein [candidate division WOR-3 bacterium]|nr:MAG: uroporphyrinogen decarboxylase family protein [candidate division WOR-3 bacterium]
MNDMLTSRERFGLLVIDEQPDRCNIMPLITSHAATVKGMKLRDYYTNGENMARAQIATVEKYEHDAISIFSEVGIIAEAMGSEFEYPENDLPILRTPVLEKKDIEEIKLPSPRADGRLPVYLEAIEYAYAALGDRIPILAYIPAPFTTAMMLSDPNKFLIQTIREPSRVESIVDRSLAAAIELCYHVIDAGGLPIIVDPLASSSVVSPKTYRQYALPSERKLVDFLHRYDLDIILHICGDTSPILDLLPQTRADLISIDQVNMQQAIDKLSSRVRIIGNYDTSRLAFSTPEDIEAEVRYMVEGALHAKKGYIAATGCEVPIKAPEKNVVAFIDTVKEVGWYWV